MGVMISVIVFVYLTWRDWGIGWASVWWLWLFIVPWPLLFLLRERNLRMSAGADWLAYGKQFVKTYDLKEIEITVGGAARYLKMTDRQGGSVHAPLHELQLNRDLWDLIYLGLLHSVYEGGASTDNRAKTYLHLGIPPDLRKWEWAE